MMVDEITAFCEVFPGNVNEKVTPVLIEVTS